jgi:hypothetical protein
MNWKSEYSPAHKEAAVSRTRKGITSKSGYHGVRKYIERHAKIVHVEVVVMVDMILMMMM